MAMFKNFSEESLCPPAHDHQPLDEAGAPLSWALLDVRAYIADRRNATTAYARLGNKVEIQVTFCIAPPPLVSYFCVWCSEVPDLNKIVTEPRILAAEADLVVLRVGHDYGFCYNDPRNEDVLVYQPRRGRKEPVLHRVVYPDINLYFNVGVLRHCHDSSPDDDQFYIIGFDPTHISWQFTVNLFDSKTQSWFSDDVSPDQQHQHSQFRHSASKVIMLGEGDLMGFVDLWRGILVCDVLSSTHLHYIPFPQPLKANKKLQLDPVNARDIAVVQGCFKVVDCSYSSTTACWMASVWSRNATSLVDDWKLDYTLEICDDLIDCYTSHLELLPQVQDDDGTIRQTLEGLHITHPILSLNNDDIVYFMAKVDPWDKRALVLAIDMRNKKLQDVSVFRAERSSGVTLSYVPCRIPKYFSVPPGIKGDLKRLGMLLPGSPRKKQAASVMSDGAAPCQNGTASTGVEDEDNMDVE